MVIFHGSPPSALSMTLHIQISVHKWLLTLNVETPGATPKLICDFAAIFANDIFNVIIHYKCVPVSWAPSGSHCLIKVVLCSIDWQCSTISHPSHSGSRWVCGGAGEGEVCGWPCTLEIGNSGCSCRIIMYLIGVDSSLHQKSSASCVYTHLLICWRKDTWYDLLE